MNNYFIITGQNGTGFVYEELKPITIDVLRTIYENNYNCKAHKFFNEFDGTPILGEILVDLNFAKFIGSIDSVVKVSKAGVERLTQFTITEE